MFRAACPNDDIAPRITKVWALGEFQIAEQARPGRGVRFRDRGEILPGKVGLDLRDICRGWARVFSVAAVNSPPHAAHQCGYLGSDRELAAGAGADKANTLDPADLRGLGPFSPSHVHLGVVYPKRLDLDDDMAWLRLGVRELLDYQVFRATELLYDDCTHEEILRICVLRLLSTGSRY
jgi:hypothetical protein